MTLSAFAIRILLLVLPGILASKVYKKLRGRPARESWETFVEILVFSLVSYAVAHMIGWDRSDRSAFPLTLKAVPPFTIQSPQPVPFEGPPEYLVAATQPTLVGPQQAQLGTLVTIRVAGPLAIAATQPIVIDGSPPVTLASNQKLTIQPLQPGTSSASIFEALLNEQIPIGGYVATILFSTAIALVLAILASYLHNYSVLNRIGRFINASKRAGDEDAWTAFNNSDDVEWVFVRDFANHRVYYGSIFRFSDSDRPKEIVLEDVQVYNEQTDKLLYCVKALYLSRDSGHWTIEVPADTPTAAPDGSAPQGAACRESTNEKTDQ